MKLSFILAGFSKCGTTSLSSLLNQHPDIFIPMDEPGYYNNKDYDQHWFKEHYHSFYDQRKEASILGDGSTFYSTIEFEYISAQRIKKEYPNIKLIFIARDPILRIESSFKEFHNSGQDWGINAPFDLETCIKEFPQIVEDTKYWSRIQNYRQYFSDTNIKVILLEEFINNPSKVTQEIFAFLGAGKFNIDKLTKLNSSESKYIDTKYLRKIRKNPLLTKQLAKLSKKRQHQLLKTLFLKRNFPKKIIWSSKVKENCINHLEHDNKKFLRYINASIESWPTFNNFLKP